MSNIPKTMKALVVYSKDEYTFEENYPTPRAGEDELILKVEACGICAGDCKATTGAPHFWDHFIKTPFVPGHEIVGTVAEVGEGVTEYKIGDRLVPEQIVPCNQCSYCESGHYWMCDKQDIFGFKNYLSGGMAEYVKIPKNANLFKIPNDMPIEKAAIIEPFSCSKHATDRANITIEDVVVISGCGTLGMGMVGIAKLHNPKTLIVLDLKQSRLDKALEFGADYAFNPNDCDVQEEVKKLTGGRGCDIYIEATGHPSSVTQGIAMVRKLGRFIEFGAFAHETSLDWSIIGDQKELDILGSHLSPNCFPWVIDWLNKDMIGSEGIVGPILPLKDWAKGFDIAAKGTDGAFKVVLVP